MEFHSKRKLLFLPTNIRLYFEAIAKHSSLAHYSRKMFWSGDLPDLSSIGKLKLLKKFLSQLNEQIDRSLFRFEKNRKIDLFRKKIAKNICSPVVACKFHNLAFFPRTQTIKLFHPVITITILKVTPFSFTPV
jgi:hypothetical protein